MLAQLGLTDFHVGLADQIVSGRKPGEVGLSLQVPDDDSWFHVLVATLPPAGR
jgi:hypothetical protein